VSAYPIVLEGSTLRATVIGGGAVAFRKVRALRDAGATVRVVARRVDAALQQFAERDDLIEVTTDAYAPEYLGGAQIVIAATDDAEVNELVARDARALGILVNVADAPERGDFVTPAVHRAGDVVIGVVTGGVPSAAGRIRDEIARRFDHRYASASSLLRELRRRALLEGDRERWARANAELTGPDFCALVENGELERRAGSWR
jgi:precorrin-2 dehydrogenase/sirohydrochlorin ferrochelatase